MIGFTGARIDRADHLRLDEPAVAALLRSEAALLLRLEALEPSVDADGSLVWDGAAQVSAEAETIFLGLRGAVPLFAPLRFVPPGARAWNLFQLLEGLKGEEAALFGMARSLIEWHNRHLYCGSCGSPTAPFRAGWGRRCPGCGAESYPRVDPVVIMLAEHEGRVLVGRQSQYPPGRYSALAGFLEPGESIEEAVARELKEEAGIEVTDVRYIASQPWPFPGSLMIGCIARATSDAITLDQQELEDAFWAERAGVAAALAGAPDAPFRAPPPFAIAHSLLAHWLAGQV